MISPEYKKIIFILALMGVLFSGYLSSVKLFSNTCAFSEPCPYFLGYPACFFGFGIFLIIFSGVVLHVLKFVSEKAFLTITVGLSFLGIIFAGYFTVPEIDKIFSGTFNPYMLGLPTCAYGLIFYILIFILSMRHMVKS